MDSDTASEADQVHGKLENLQIVTVPFVNWESVKIIESSPEFRTSIKQLSQTLRENSSSEAGSEAVRERKSKVSAELTRHGLEVVEEGDNLIISGTVVIQPPFTHQTCDAPNEIILARIRNILKSIS